MRQLRFVFIALLASLFVINATLLRKTIAVLLCGVLSFNLASYYSFLNQGEIANAATPRSRTPVTAGKNALPSSNPKYQFQLVAKAEMVVDGQTLVDPGATASGLSGTYRKRLIDDKGRIAYYDSGRIFLDDRAVAFKGKQIANFVINEVGNHFLFKNGTLDILADAFDTQNQRNSKILIRDGKPLATFANSSSISPQIYPECTLNLNEPGCTANAYYLYAYYKNYFRFDANGFKEISIQEAEKRIKSSPVAFQEKTKDRYECIGNNKNQVICSLTDPSRLLVRNDGKVFPSGCCDYVLNNNGKILTFNDLKVFDYNKDAIPANSIKNLRKDLETAVELHGLKVPYGTLLDIPKNVDWKDLKHNTAKISDNGDIAIIVQQQLGNPYIDKNKAFFASAIIRATPSGLVTAKEEPEHPAYECAEYEAKIHNPYWQIFVDAANRHSKDYPEITPSLIAAIAAQESGGPGASFPDNTKYPHDKKGKRTGSATGMFQINFGGAANLGYTITQVLDTQAATKYPKLDNYFKTLGITPTKAKNVKEAANWVSDYLVKLLGRASVKGYGIRGAIGAYKEGNNWRDDKGNETTETAKWDIDKTSTIPSFVKELELPVIKGPVINKIRHLDYIEVPYIESVQWHQKLIDDAEKKCNQ